MKKLISSKKWFFYITSFLLLLYNFIIIFVIMGNGKYENLYSIKTCQSYYLFSFMFISAVSYTIDVETKKETGFLTLFGQPIFSFSYLFLCLITGGIETLEFTLLALGLLILIVGGYFIYRKVMPKLVNLKFSYKNILLIYVIVHLTIVLFAGFYLMTN